MAQAKNLVLLHLQIILMDLELKMNRIIIPTLTQTRQATDHKAKMKHRRLHIEIV